MEVRWLQRLGLGLVGLQPACATEPFVCTTDAVCGSEGTCELNGYCSFPDSQCESGSRYGQFAGSGVGGQCVPRPQAGSSSSGPAGSATASSGTSSSGGATTSPSTVGPMETTGGLACTADWWDCQWQRRRVLSIDTTMGTEPLADVPLFVAIEVKDDDALFAAEGADLRLVDDTGSVLDHELSFGFEGRVAGIWFRLPVYGPSTPAVSLYYDSPGAPDGQNPAGVWQSQYVGVWHLDGTRAESISGSSVTVEDATLVDGLTGSAYSFDGMAGAVIATLDPNLDDIFAAGGSIEAWSRPTTTGQSNFGRIVEKASGPPNDDGMGLYVGGGMIPRVRFNRAREAGPQLFISDPDAFELGVWSHFTLNFDDTDALALPQVWVDGAAVAMEPTAMVVGDVVTDAGFPVIIGNSEARSRTFDGQIDEVRLSRSVRSQAWVTVQLFASQGLLVEVGDAQQRP